MPRLPRHSRVSWTGTTARGGGGPALPGVAAGRPGPACRRGRARGGDGAGAGSTGEWTPRTLRGRGGLPRLLHHLAYPCRGVHVEPSAPRQVHHPAEQARARRARRGEQPAEPGSRDPRLLRPRSGGRKLGGRVCCVERRPAETVAMRVVTVREPVPRLPNGRIDISDWLESGGHRRVVQIVALVDQLRSHLAPALVPSGFLDASVVLPAPVEAQW